MKTILKALLILFAVVSPLHAQLWSSIIDSNRAMDWTNAGVVGGIPTVSTACAAHSGTIASSTNIATLNTDIADCVGGGSPVVLTLGSGTFTLAGALHVQGNNLVIRGQGPSTILNFTSFTGSVWPWGSAGVFEIISTTSPFTTDGAPGVGGIPAGTIKTWTGTDGVADVFTRGSTVFNLSSVSGLSVGDQLACWQDNDADGSVPTSNYFISDKNGAASSVSWQGEANDFGAAQEHRSMVTAINGTAVTVADGIPLPTGSWKTASNPKCGWLTAAHLVKNVGLENMTIQSTAIATNHLCVICGDAVYNFWIHGVVLRPRFTSFHANGAVDYGIEVKDSVHVTVSDNWIDKMIGGGINTVTSYGIVFPATHFARLENNIFNNVESPIEIIYGTVGAAYLYNFENYVGDDSQESGMQTHSAGYAMNLIEGNSFLKYYSEIIHGNGYFNTIYRNHMQNGGVDLWSYVRWMNVIGNAMNCSTKYESLPADATTLSRQHQVCFRLNYPEELGTAEGYLTNSNYTVPMGDPGAGGVISPDTGVKASLFRWGNYTAFDTTTRFDSGEVPTAGTQFTNSVPASNTLPASFIYSVSPSWWPTGVAWPIIGSDVTGGTYVSGHAKKTPAQLCFEAAGGTNGSYSSTAANSFAPSTCYDGGGAGQGSAATTSASGRARLHR